MSERMSLRHEISPTHPIFGGVGWRMLEDYDELCPEDQTACVSMMLSMEGDEWIDIPLDDNWSVFGKTVEWYCTESTDADREERIFRRRVL
jgi:hypothetical protein